MSSGAVKPRRVRSAKARLTPTQPSQVVSSLGSDALERQASAKAIRDKHNGSNKVFPRPSSRGTKERFSTMYSSDYDGTFAPAAELRPTSPTRRHNPHPGKQFMVWRLPDREIGGDPVEPEGLELPPEYITRNSDFDAIEELNSGLGALKLPPPQPTSHEYGAYLRQQRQQREAYQRQLQQQQQGVVSHNMGPEVMDRTLREELAPNLQHWMTSATPEEKHTILKMLKSAEDAQVNETINDVMQPPAAKAVRKWMKTADDKERQVAVRLFSSLGGQRTGRARSMSEPSIRPLSRQPFPPASLAPPPRSSKGQRLSSRQQASRSGSRSAAPQKPWPAGLWHHLPVRDPPPQVYHRGALFGGVRGDASHFNVHPEWPDYYGTSFNSDTVHT